MDIYGCNFEYAGKSSRTYALIFATVDTSRHNALAGQTQTISFYNSRDKKRYYIGTSYDSSALTFDAEVVSRKPIDPMYQRQIEKWLFGQTSYKKLYMDYLDDYLATTYEIIGGERKRLYLNCKFVNPSKIEAGGVVGYRFTVECDSHLAWQDPIKEVFQLNHNTSTASSILEIDVDSDSGDYIYPKVSIIVGTNGGTISVINQTDDGVRITQLVDVTPNAKVTLNGATNFITDGYYDRFAYKNFVRLLDGKNNISVIGDVQSISFEWQNMRYL